MKKMRVIAFLLSLIMLASTAVPGTMALTAHAAGEEDKGMEISKTAVDNGDGTYTITLEAYATGKKISTEVTKDVPTDIILVLDQSGSMGFDMGTVSFSQYQDEHSWGYTEYHTRNQDYYEYRHNGGSGNLWHKLSDGTYVSVSVTKKETVSYTELSTNTTNSDYYTKTNILYEKVGDTYQPVTVTRTGSYRNRTYTFDFSDGTSLTSQGADTVPDLGAHAPLYTATVDGSKTIYTYSYTDSTGNTVQIGTSTGDTTVFTPTLYKRSVSTSGGGSRLDALKKAVKNFSDAVAKKAAGEDGVLGTSDDVNHRVAVVGFASKSGYGDNTELLSIKGTNSGSVGIKYDNITTQNLKDVLQSMDTAAGKTMVSNAINALTANGATQADLGMDMANRILDANPVPEGERRSRVVVFFTDGSPTSGNQFEKEVADAAILKARTIKSGGASVYSVGIFNGADASSAGNVNGNDTQKSNWFMQNVSSNNGVPKKPSYYLSASDSATLNNIFQQISDNIQEGGSSTTLNKDAVIKDIISPQFQLPEGATANGITLKTYAYTAENTWRENSNAMEAVATVNGDNVDVTGFDFSENWCGTETTNGNTTYRGNKLVISFNVTPKAGFLGGNGVYTNTSAGVYENADADEPSFTFDRPQVDVEINDITVTPVDKNVYLMGGLTAEQIKSGATAKVGNVDLKLDEENFGLEPWQNEYVDISVTYTDADGKVVTDLSNLRNDTTYTISVEVSPKNTGMATEQTGVGSGKINVFTPELTYKDSEVYYGADAPTNFSENLVPPTAWKHGKTLDSSVTMTGTAPDLTMSYTSEDGAIVDGKIDTKQDIPVDVTVMINDTNVTEDVSFLHRNCAVQTCVLPEGKEFLLHVKTATLTITKQGSDSRDPGQGYIFDVTGPNDLHFTVSVEGNGSVTISGLPFGDYTITEQQNWSWRYDADGVKTATINKDTLNPTVIVTNTRNNPYLLDGNAYAQNNAVKSGSAN